MAPSTNGLGNVIYDTALSSNVDGFGLHGLVQDRSEKRSTDSDGRSATVVVPTTAPKSESANTNSNASIGVGLDNLEKNAVRAYLGRFHSDFGDRFIDLALVGEGP
jgi:hypothetical protein